VSARFERSSLDTSGTPATIKESGFTDLAAQARLRLASEQGKATEIFASLEFIPATHRGKKLISDRWTDLKGEIGLVRGFQFGTMTLKTTVEWNHGTTLGPRQHRWSTCDRCRPSGGCSWRSRAARAGAMDEWVFVTAAQWRISIAPFSSFPTASAWRRIHDWEPQVGIMLAFHEQLGVRLLRNGPPWGDMWPPSGGPWFCSRSAVLVPTLLAQATATAPIGTVPAWTVRLSGDIRWQQVTPAGALLVSTDGALVGVDIEKARSPGRSRSWRPPSRQRPHGGGLAAHGSGEAGLSMIFDPVTGTVLFDSRRLNLTQVVTRRVLTQTGTLIVHGRRASGPPVVALYDLATGNQRW